MAELKNIKAQVQDALKHAKNLGAAAKIGMSCGEKMTVDFEAGRLKDTGSAQAMNFSVDALVKGRRGQAICVDPGDLRRTVERAVTLARLGSIAHFDAWPAPGKTVPIPAFSESTAAVQREKFIEACGWIADALKSYDSNLFINCGAQKTLSERLLITSGGVEHSIRGSFWSLGANVQRTQGTDMLFAGDGRAWCEMNEYFDPKAILDKILFQLKNSASIVPAPTGKIKAFLSTETLELLLWPLYMGIQGRRVAKGESPLIGKLGKRILSEAFTIIDDPHKPFAPGSAEIDQDGVPTRKQALIEKGVLSRFLYDLDSSGLAKAEPTGNNNCSPYCPTVTPGKRKSSELLSGIDDGLYLTSNLIGFGQSNISNGDFSCNVGLGYRIKNGEIVGRVKNTMIAGNIYEILAGNVELSSDTSYNGMTPYAVVEGIASSTKQ